MIVVVTPLVATRTPQNEIDVVWFGRLLGLALEQPSSDELRA